MSQRWLGTVGRPALAATALLLLPAFGWAQYGPNSDRTSYWPGASQNYNPGGYGYGYGYYPPYSWGRLWSRPGGSPGSYYPYWDNYYTFANTSPRYSYSPPPDNQAYLYGDRPDNRAYLRLRVPANAQVFFGGQPTSQSGVLRTFYSPPLVPGLQYRYEIRAQWTENGQEISQTRQVPVTANSNQYISFSRVSPATTPGETEMRSLRTGGSGRGTVPNGTSPNNREPSGGGTPLPPADRTPRSSGNQLPGGGTTLPNGNPS
jgi:uncharacterized protein (TIGR03000 family)